VAFPFCGPAPATLPADLATQLSLVFTAFSTVSIIVVNRRLIAQIRTARSSKVGQNFQILAETNAERVGTVLGQQIDASSPGA